MLLINSLQVTITDNDLIEKSNLNRQFLFRPRHIQVRGRDGERRAIVDLNHSRILIVCNSVSCNAINSVNDSACKSDARISTHDDIVSLFSATEICCGS
jgi:molybdopterin/thiamine biosynthesis adenylyltransferase